MQRGTKIKKISDREKYILKKFLHKAGGLRLEKILSPKQLAFATDPARLVAALTSRQAGKTWATCCLMLHTALMTGENVAYCGLTRPSAKSAIFPMVERLDRQYNLGCKFKTNDGIIELRNGATISLFGLDASPQEQQKLRGKTLILVVIDECGHYIQDLREIIESAILATIQVLKGKLVLIGTPGNLLQVKDQSMNNKGANYQKRTDFFYKVTEKLEEGWEVHKWNATENPFTSEGDLALRELRIKANPRIEETPSWKREVLGQWVIDDQAQCFKYTEANNACYVIPKQDYIYSLGLDFGWKAPSALVVCAYGLDDKIFYVIEEFKKVEMSIEDIGNKIQAYQSKYHITGYFCDTNDPRTVEELGTRYGIPLKNSDKHNKYEFIQLINNDLLMGNIKILKKDAKTNTELINELETCIWDESIPTQVFSGCSDHLADALRYAWRQAYHYVRQKQTIIIPEHQQIDKAVDAYFKKKITDKKDMFAFNPGGKNYLKKLF